ncbi:Microbial collagenase precursor [Polystyrenella longa]|uniref:Microbial collagenase n=1 Tax=Polystyrenella longa TaxID=2528007 RepID=A0A518CRQ8_9PLAN|nr:PKD domain-containing protein [Polystyrenella longa]QDU81898.1 Microbial collagenase precursor [Polystyrenella longa]
MNKRHQTTRNFSSRKAGLSLLEVVMSTLLISILMLTALRTVGASFRAEFFTAQQTQAMLFAEDLLSEIIQMEYEEPVDPVSFGRETGEVGTNRTTWDDVDDYNGWTSSPLQYQDGTEIPDTSSWTRAVSVQFVLADSPDTTTNDDEGLKKITVTISKNNVVLGSLSVLQSKAWINTIPDPNNNLSTGSKPSVNQSPIAVASASPTSGTSSVNVQFDATNSSDSDGDSITFSWDYGDGSSGTGSKPSHTFTNGTGSTLVRIVTLTASDSSGAQATKTLTITINP